MNVTHWIRKTIAFTDGWIPTLYIGCILGAILISILIFLQPFDTYTYDSPTKNLELAGYGPIVVLVVLAIHFPEKWIFRMQKRRWLVWNEAVFLLFGCFLMLSASYVYNSWVINRVAVGLVDWWRWLQIHGGPFLPFLVPPWLFLRARFGTIEREQIIEEDTPITIVGQNKSEELSIRAQDFIYAQAQQNYADIFYKKAGDRIEKKMLRITLTQLKKQVPVAQQVHRSYLVNLGEVEKLEGNARKRLLTLKNILEPIPLSKKYYSTVKKRLSDSSQ